LKFRLSFFFFSFFRKKGTSFVLYRERIENMIKNRLSECLAPEVVVVFRSSISMCAASDSRCLRVQGEGVILKVEGHQLARHIHQCAADVEERLWGLSNGLPRSLERGVALS